ncbi:MAG: chromate efflux transporter, partial [Anaerolineaceae bacterium]
MSELVPSDNLPITPAHTKEALWEYVRVCLKIGATSFGAPTAHIAMMENEFVRRHKWVSEELFLDALSAANLVPGPNASELCYHVGYIRAGYPGLILGGLAFITPSFITTTILAALYVRFGTLPQIAGMFYVLNPLVLAIVIDTTWRISKMSFKGWQQVAIFGIALGAKLLGLNETFVLLLAGLLGILFHHTLNHRNDTRPPVLMALGLPLISLTGLVNQVAAWWNDTLAQIFLYFFKTGSVMFGSAMVLFALIEKDVTTRFGWVTMQQLTDAIAVGQITPGPVTSASAFIGYLVGGLPGSALAMIGVFLPSFIIVMITAPMLAKLQNSPIAKAFLKGV